jgi:hypothetical protein
MNGTDLIVPGDQSPYELLKLDSDEMQELVASALSPGETLTPRDLTRVKVPGAGATSWEVSTLRGDESFKELRGVILRIDTRRAYWPKAFGGENDPPDCTSDDGVNGVGDPGVACAECPFNEFGSHRDGISKACKEMRQVFIVPRDGILPMVLTVPPTSLANIKSYRMKLLGARMKPTDLETVLTLEKAESKAGFKYARIIPLAGELLDPAAADRFRAFSGLLAPTMDRTAVHRDDVDSADDDDE